MAKKGKAGAKYDLKEEAGIYAFSYKPGKPGTILEELMCKIADYLVGQRWLKDQIADLLFVGIRNGKQYFLNQPSEAAAEKLADEYGQREIPRKRRIANERLDGIIVRNMVLDWPESEILRGKVVTDESGWSQIQVSYLGCDNHEIRALIRALVRMRLLDIHANSRIEWLYANCVSETDDDVV